MAKWRDIFMTMTILSLAAAGFAHSETKAPSEPAKPAVSPQETPKITIDAICTLIAREADAKGLPKDYFARLIWKESRFDHQAVSPVGAQGIAQFMPGTAKIVGLADPFDIEQAIPASAAYLAKLQRGFGNWGLAAAAYNGGETRVGNWLANGGFLPLETEDYVLDITGQSADHFATRSNEIAPRPLDAKLTFDEACRKLPVIAASTVAMSRVNRKPWGIQVAGNFRQSAASRQWERVRRAHPDVLSNHKAVISRIRTPIGRRSIFAVRIGANSRSEADRICIALRSSGGACIVTKNR
jgi:Transglycosylase SLT domain/SPOR domain